MVIRMSGSAASPGVGPELGVQGSDTIKLSAFNSATSKTRTYSLGTDVYNRVNGNEVGVGKAPSPAAGTPANLSDWGDSSFNQYEQWNFDQTAGREDTGSGFDILVDTGFTGGGTCKSTASFSWDNTYYASNFDAGAVRHNIYVKLCVDSGIYTNCGSGGSGGTTCKTDCQENDDMDPFSVDPEQLNADDTSPYTYKLQGSGSGDLQANKYYVVGVEWDWADQTAGTYRQRSEVDPASSFTYTFGSPVGRNPDAGDGSPGYGIVFKLDAEPDCQSNTVRWNTDTSDFCSACTTGTGTKYYDAQGGSAWNNGVEWYDAQDGTCSKLCTTPLGSGFIVNTTTDTAYTMSSGVLSDNNTGDCTTCPA